MKDVCRKNVWGSPSKLSNSKQMEGVIMISGVSL